MGGDRQGVAASWAEAVPVTPLTLQDLKVVNSYLKSCFLIFPNYNLGHGLMEMAYNEYINEYYAKIGEGAGRWQSLGVGSGWVVGALGWGAGWAGGMCPGVGRLRWSCLAPETGEFQAWGVKGAS